MVGLENQLRIANKSICDDWSLDNTNFDKQVLMAAILMKGGTFEPLYTDPEYFRSMSTYWWLKWSRTFNKWFDALDLQYNPIEDYYKHDVIHEDEAKTGTDDTATTSREVVDEDGTSRKDSTTNVVTDKDTTSTEGYTESEVTDDDTTYSKTGSTTETPNTTNRLVKSGSVREVMQDATTGTLRAPGASGSNSVVTESQVSAFDSNTYQPHDKTTQQINKSEDTTGSDNRTTTTTYDGATDVTTMTGNTVTQITESGSGTDDKTVKTTGSKNGSGTEDETVDTTYGETGSTSKDRTTTLTGSKDTDTSSDRDFDKTATSNGIVSPHHTRQGLLAEELKIQAWNVYEHIADVFVRELTVRVY